MDNLFVKILNKFDVCYENLSTVFFHCDLIDICHLTIKHICRQIFPSGSGRCFIIFCLGRLLPGQAILQVIKHTLF